MNDSSRLEQDGFDEPERHHPVDDGQLIPPDPRGSTAADCAVPVDATTDISITSTETVHHDLR